MRSVIFLAVLLSGCAVSPQRAAGMSDTDLCLNYGSTRDTLFDSPALLTEVRRRELIRPEANNAFRSGYVQLGMTELEAICTWGRPSAVNRTATRYGTSEQWVYERYLGATTGSIYRFVYVSGGKVTAVQD